MSRVVVAYNFCGINLHMPEDIADMFPKEFTYETFPTVFCGAGESLVEKIVPDYIFGFTKGLSFIGLDFSIKISPACWIHDQDWWFARPEISSFNRANERLRFNMNSIVETKARNELAKCLSLYRTVTYMNAVELKGKGIFWSIKAGQGYRVPKEFRGITIQSIIDKTIKQVEMEK
jgi:hypothetical protein